MCAKGKQLGVGKNNPCLITGETGRMKEFEAVARSKWNNYNVVLKKKKTVFYKSQMEGREGEINYNLN